MRIGTLRPGLLVSLNTSLHGNVTYRRRDIEPEHRDEDGARRAAWETRRTTISPEEHDEAIKVRGKARSLISAVCAQSAHGLLCPVANEAKLETAIAEARELVAAFNDAATLSRIDVYVIIGRIAQDDVEAVRAINSEVRNLLDAMEGGLKNLDVKTVREAANRARGLSSMLSDDAQGRVKQAIEVARSAARQIVKAGEEAAVAIDAQTLRTLRESRVAFLDFTPEGGEAIQAPTDTGRALDLEMAPEAVVALPVPAVLSPVIEF